MSINTTSAVSIIGCMLTAKISFGWRSRLVALLSGQALDMSILDDVNFWQVAADEGVVAVLWHAVCGHPVSAAVKALVSPYLRMQTVEAMQFRQATEEVLTAANHAGISMLCLRGQALAETLYEKPSMRPQGDIDILVGSADVPELTAELQQLGFVPMPVYPMTYERGQVLLEVHTEIIGITRIASRAYMTSLRTAEFFRQARQGSLCSQPALLLEHSILMPYLCLHALKHSFDRLVWLWDIALLARRIDAEQAWPEVADGIHNYQLERPCYYALSYVHKHFAVPVAGEVIQSIRPAMDWRETSMFARFMAHETIPYMAERLFARMMPDMNTRLAFWHETIFPRQEVREQFLSGTGCADCNFIRDRLKRLFGMLFLAWREARALFRVP